MGLSIVDAINTYLEIVSEERILVQEADSAKVGDEVRADIPDAEKLNFLLVKGHNNRRIRITGLVGVVEQ